MIELNKGKAEKLQTHCPFYLHIDKIIYAVAVIIIIKYIGNNTQYWPNICDKYTTQ